MKTVTSKQMQKLEQMAIEEMEIPSIQLMENAALSVAKHCFRFLKTIINPKILIICGTGNNGGDGMALARHLFFKGVETQIIYVGDIDAAKGDAAIYLTIIKNSGIPFESIHPSVILDDDSNETKKQLRSFIETSDLTVDAMLGTGLDRNVEGNFKYLTEAINSYAKYVISVDIPSGIHSDTGRIMGCAVKASETVTFSSPKTGLYVFPGAEHAGKIHIEDITIPAKLLDRIEIQTEILTDSEAKNLLPKRKQRSNKGDFGKVLVFAGSNEMPGAAALACSASYMAGCGLVCACVVSHVAQVIHHWQREVITCTVPDINGMYCKKSLTSVNGKNLTDEINNASVIIIGPGIGRSSDVKDFIIEVLNISKTPIVMDADALFAISENMNILKTLKAPCVITPHPGEMSRLTGLSVQEILDDTISVTRNFSKEFNVVTLLKDAHTIIAGPNNAVNINITGNNALSKAGTGDVLTGMIAGFIAQGADVFTASILGAYFHGKSCEAACNTMSRYSITASDIISHIPIVMKN